MKKLFILLIVFFIPFFTFGDDDTTTTCGVSSSDYNPVATYRLYPTRNRWVFLKLNTQTGQIRIIQFDVQDDNRLDVALNSLDLVTDGNYVNGRFTLYSTRNIWTFILLDQITGQAWQVQWSFEASNRGILRIDK